MRQSGVGDDHGDAALPGSVLLVLGLAGAVVTVAGMKAFAAVLGPAFLGLMLTVTVGPLIGWLHRHRWPMWLSVTAAILTAYLVVLSIGGIIVVSLVRLVDALPQYRAQFETLFAEVRSVMHDLGLTDDQVRHAGRQVNLPGLVNAVLDSLTAGLSNVVLTVALVLFMGLDAAGFPARLSIVGASRPAVVQALDAFARGTRRYLLVTTVFGLIVAVVDGLVLWAMGVPLPVLWAVLAFVTNYIPNVGFLIGLVPPALLALLTGGPALMLGVVVAYSLINFVIQSIIQPRFVGKAVGLSTTVTLLAVVFWGWVLGAVGALLAIPLTLLAKGLLIDSDPATRWIGLFISSDSSPSPPVPHTASRQPGPPPSGQAPDPDVVPAPGPVREPGPVPVGPRPG